MAFDAVTIHFTDHSIAAAPRADLHRLQSPLQARIERLLDRVFLVAGKDSSTKVLGAHRILSCKSRAARESFVLPIDECYRLVGLMRTHWKGLSGGAVVWREMKLFFEEMKNRSVVSYKNA